MIQKIVFLLVFSLFAKGLDGLRCYECDSWSNGNCRSPSSKRTIPSVICENKFFPKLNSSANINEKIKNETFMLLNATRLATILSHPTSCGKMVFDMFGNRVTVRGCVSDGMCSSFESDTRKKFPFLLFNGCHICTSHLCNSASTISSTLLFILFSLFLPFFIKI